MSKTKTPFFSMGAKGTVGDAITFQKHGSGTIARTKPIPRDPYSLKQAYQRWDYKDYAYLWTLLSNSEKQVYRTRGSRYHITGFSQWMREKLNTLPDLAGRWRLDETSGSIAHDSSPNANHGTIFGASPIIGSIGGAYSFDGLNDYVIVPHSPTLSFAHAFSVEFILTFHSNPSGYDDFLTKGAVATDPNYFFYTESNSPKVRFKFKLNGVIRTYLFTPAFSLHTPYHNALTYDGTYLRFYLDADLIHDQNLPGIVSTNTSPLFMARSPGHRYAPIILDNVIIYNRALDATEVTRHSKRRYPA